MFQDDPKEAALRRIYMLTWCVAVSVVLAAFVLRYFWPPPFSDSQQIDIFVAIVCFAFGVAVVMRLLFRKYQVTSQEYRAYVLRKPLMKIFAILIIVYPLIELIKSFF